MKKERITCAREVYELLAPSLGHEKKEHLAAVFLDVRHHIIKHETIFVGSLDTTVIHPREIFKQAIRYSSSAVIIAHNHPSGDPSPSPEDISVTKQLVNAGKIVGINLIDHIIITANDYVSLREQREDII
jgi:DNA repair protein RadC